MLREKIVHRIQDSYWRCFTRELQEQLSFQTSGCTCRHVGTDHHTTVQYTKRIGWNFISSRLQSFAKLQEKMSQIITDGNVNDDGKARAEKTKLDFRCTICRSAIGQASCSICARRHQLTFPFCCQINVDLENLRFLLALGLVTKTHPSHR